MTPATSASRSRAACRPRGPRGRRSRRRRRSANDWSARPSRASPRGARLRKTWVSGSRTRPRSRQTKPRRAGATAKSSAASSGKPVARLEDPRLDLAQHPLRAQRVTAVRERDDDAVARADERPRARSRPRLRPRAAIAGRCASNANGWPRGNGSSSGRRRGRARLPAPPTTPRTSSGSPDEVGPAVEWRDEVVGGRWRGAVLLVVRELDLAEVEPALGGRVHGRLARRRAGRAA